MKIVLSIVLLLITFFSDNYGQERDFLNSDYPFEDGLYLSFEEFKSNTPSIKAREIKIMDIDSTDYHLKNISKIKVKNPKGKFKTYSMKKIWGLCFQGQPYINYRGGLFEAGANKGNKSFTNDIFSPSKVTFARLDIIGSLCVFTLEGGSNIYSTNTMVNYSSQSDRVFVRNMLLDLQTGNIYECSYESVLFHVQNDEELVDEMHMFHAAINLFDIVLSYNNRHPVYADPVSIQYEETEEPEEEELDIEIIENY